MHPLLRLAVYEQIPRLAVPTTTVRAALSLAVAGGSALAVGSHLLRASPSGDQEVVSLLLTAANAAYVGGDLNAAITLLRRALAEPPDQPLRGAVLARLGQMEALAHDPACVEHLGEALAISDAPAARVAVATTLGEVLVWGGGRSIEAYEMLSARACRARTRARPAPAATLETLRVATASVDARLAPRIGQQRDDLLALAEVAGPAGRALKIFDACWSAQTEGVGSSWCGAARRGSRGWTLRRRADRRLADRDLRGDRARAQR